MKQALINWAVPFILGLLVTAITTVYIKEKALSDGVRCLLRADIIKQYEMWSAKGYCPIYAKESITMEYKAYHKLNGNDVATELYNKIMQLKSQKG